MNCLHTATQIRRYTDRCSRLLAIAMTSNQLPDVVIGFAAPPPPRKISKLSLEYWCDKRRLRQASMPVIPVNPNHPAASAARKRTPIAAVRELPVSVAAIAATAGSVASNSSNSRESDSDIHGVDRAASGCKSTGLPKLSDQQPLEDYFSAGGDDVDDNMDNDLPTDAEASKDSFLDRLEHYMERVIITEDNCKAVELAIMVEAGTTVREMDPMKKEIKEKALLNSYVSIIEEIPDNRFEDVRTRPAMLLAYKGARKKLLKGGTLWRKYESELNEVRKFTLKFLGVGSLSRLPSGTTQLQQMKRLLIIKLWKEKYPAESGVDYDDDISVWGNIPKGWWLNHAVCKYILSCLAHKDNKDITMKPTQQPPGYSRVEARGRKEKALEGERAATKADRPVKKFGDVDHQIKKIRVEGLQSLVLKNRADVIKTRVNAIRTQIELMQQMESVYARRMGQDKYDDMIVSLINQLPLMDASTDFSVTARSSSNNELPGGGVSILESHF